MKTNGYTYNFNRMLRVTISDGSTSQVVEYCPLADEKLNPRIDVVIKCMPLVVNKNNKPGFSAKITLYNPGEEILGLINKHITWPIGNKTQAEYYRGRCRVTVDAGYYEKGAANPRGGYSNMGALGSWWLNSSAYYRKGVDNILELWCHELQLTDDEIQDITKAVETKKVNYSKAIVEKKKERGFVGSNGVTWDMALELVIRKFAPLKAPLGSTVYESSEAQMSLLTTVPTATDRSGKTKFFKLQYIQQPVDESQPRIDAKADHELELLAQKESTRGLVINGSTFSEKIGELIDYFPVPVVVREDMGYTDGMTRYWIWRPRKGDGSLSASDSGEKKEHKQIVTIYNFENMLQVPSVDASGCFTAKMMFNPALRPNVYLKLAWSDDYRSGQAISNYTEGVSTSSTFANYYPTLQGGKYQAQVKALRYKKMPNSLGYLFNEAYKIGYVTHTLSTHTNSWYTEVKTLAIIAGS